MIHITVYYLFIPIMLNQSYAYRVLVNQTYLKLCNSDLIRILNTAFNFYGLQLQCMPLVNLCEVPEVTRVCLHGQVSWQSLNVNPLKMWLKTDWPMSTLFFLTRSTGAHKHCIINETCTQTPSGQVHSMWPQKTIRPELQGRNRQLIIAQFSK